MVRKVLPTNDAARLKFLQRAVNAHMNDEAAGNVLLRTETAAKAQSLANEFQMAHAAVKRQKEQRSHASRIVNERTDLLGVSLTELYKSIRTRVNGGWLPKELLTHYGLPQKGKNPRPTNREGWLPLATTAVEGHYAAQAEGLPTLEISDVEQYLAEAQAAVVELHKIQDRLKDAQILRRGLRPQVLALARSVFFELHSLLFEQPASTRRDLMRGYGFEWKSSKEEGAENGPDGEAESGVETGVETGVENEAEGEEAHVPFAAPVNGAVRDADTGSVNGTVNGRVNGSVEVPENGAGPRSHGPVDEWSAEEVSP